MKISKENADKINKNIIDTFGVYDLSDYAHLYHIRAECQYSDPMFPKCKDGTDYDFTKIECKHLHCAPSLVARGLYGPCTTPSHAHYSLERAGFRQPKKYGHVISNPDKAREIDERNEKYWLSVTRNNVLIKDVEEPDRYHTKLNEADSFVVLCPLSKLECGVRLSGLTADRVVNGEYTHEVKIRDVIPVSRHGVDDNCVDLRIDMTKNYVEFEAINLKPLTYCLYDDDELPTDVSCRIGHNYRVWMNELDYDAHVKLKDAKFIMIRFEGFCILSYIGKPEELRDEAIHVPSCVDSSVIGATICLELVNAKMVIFKCDSLQIDIRTVCIKVIHSRRYSIGRSSLLSSAILEDGHSRGTILVDNVVTRDDDGFVDDIGMLGASNSKGDGPIKYWVLLLLLLVSIVSCDYTGFFGDSRKLVAFGSSSGVLLRSPLNGVNGSVMLTFLGDVCSSVSVRGAAWINILVPDVLYTHEEYLGIVLNYAVYYSPNCTVPIFSANQFGDNYVFLLYSTSIDWNVYVDVLRVGFNRFAVKVGDDLVQDVYIVRDYGGSSGANSCLYSTVFWLSYHNVEYGYIKLSVDLNVAGYVNFAAGNSRD